MKKRLLSSLTYSFIIPLFFFCSCSTPFYSKALSATSFDTFLEKMFQQEIAENTINLHFTLAHPNEVGIANYEVTLGDFSDSARADDLARTENYLTTLEAFSANNLSLEQELSRDVFIDYFELQLAMAPYSLYEEPLSPSGGVHAQLPLLFEEYAFYDEGDIKDYLQLLSQLDDYFAQIICFEKEKVAAGLFMPDYACRSVIDQCREFVADAEEHFLI